MSEVSLVESGGQYHLPHVPGDWFWLSARLISPRGLSYSRRLAWASCLRVPRGEAWKLKDLFNSRLISCSALFVDQSNSQGQAQIRGLFLIRGAASSNCKGTHWDGGNYCSCFCKESKSVGMER